jgi:hypothetical protein
MNGALHQENAAVVREHDAGGDLWVEEKDESTGRADEPRRLAGFQDTTVEPAATPRAEPIDGRLGHSSSSRRAQ